MNAVIKQPPHSMEAERSVLGAMLLSETSAVTALSQLVSEDFYSERHRHIFAAMQDVAVNNGPVDMVLVLERMTRFGYKEDDQLEYLSDLMSAVPSVGNIAHYIEIIKDKSMLRRLIDAARGIEKDAMEDAREAADIVLDASNAIYDIAIQKGHDTLRHIHPALIESYQHIGEVYKSKNGIIGATTGFTTLDRMLSGLQGSQLIIIAGRPGMGKTSFALDIVRHSALNERTPCAVFSLEMSAAQLSTRLMCAVAQVDMQHLRQRTQQTSEAIAQLIPAMETISRSPIYIDDSTGLNAAELMAKCKKMKLEHGLGLVMIDYLQLMVSGERSENRQLEIASITRSLKIAAKELDVPILLLSQLSRASERRGGGEGAPMLSDLRDSGAIEQDADVVIFIQREKDSESQSSGDRAKLIVAKQRMGPTGTVECKWVGPQTRFVEIDNRYSEQV